MANDVFRLERGSEPSLRCALWTPKEHTRGTLLITQGYAESIERYEHVAEAWSAGGFSVAAYDLRGQGLSAGRRGHVDRFADFTRDLYAVLDKLNTDHGWNQFGPSVLFGHSLGALISTVAALDQPHRFRGLGLGSPFFGLALKPAAWKLFLGRRLTNIWPTYKDRSGLSLDLLTHDPSRVAIMQADKLRFQTVTARWFTETEHAQNRVRAEFVQLELPVFCLASSDDYVADVEATRQIFAGSAKPQHKLEVVPNTYHELHQEVQRDEYLARFQTAFTQWC
jgi:alpha-beta hydrolase superfamily lysophospholipase